MSDDLAVEILKKAILLEKRGKAFYSNAAQNSENDDVKNFFELMASEEDKHVEVLSNQFKSYRKDRKFTSDVYDDQEVANVASAVLTAQMRQRLSAAGFEAAAISAAMAMEEQAIKLYSERAQTAVATEEKELYNWLAAWEKEPLELLAAIDKEITEEIWHDNNFWPF